MFTTTATVHCALFSLLTIWALASAATVRAQDNRNDTRIGFGIGYHRNQEAPMEFPASVGCTCGGEEIGSIVEYSIYVEGGTFSQTDIGKVGMFVRLRGSLSRGSSFSIITGYGGHMREYHDFTIESSHVDMFTELLLPPHLMLRWGSSFGFRHFTSIEATRRRIEPSQDDNALVRYDGAWPDAESISVAALAQVAVSIPIDRRVAIIVEMGTRYELSVPSPGHAWPAIHPGIGVTTTYTY